MSDPLCITYEPRPGATPERELAALAECYRILLDECAEERANETNGREEHRAPEEREHMKTE